MSTYAKLVIEQRRLTILRVLANTPGYETSQSMLYQVLPTFGPPASARQIADDLTFLGSLDLVTLHAVEGVLMARITQLGLDVAKGLHRVQGVKVPGPEDV